MALTGNKLFIITGAEGSGKTRVLDELDKVFDYHRFQYLTTHTPKEKGYKQIDWKEFQELAENDAFVFSYEKEKVMVGAEYAEVERGLKSGKPVLWEVDIKWVEKVLDDFPGTTVVVINSVSFENFYEHFKKKGKAIPSSLAHLARASNISNKELSNLANYVVENAEGKSKEAAEQLKKIIEGK